MIALIYGQPSSGKTTLATSIVKMYKLCVNHKIVHLDGDNWRNIINNKVYDKEGRIKNCESAFKLALELESQGFAVILSFVCPYESLRDFLREKTQLVELYLHTEMDRGRKHLYASDFEVPSDDKKVLVLNTSELNVFECTNLFFEKFILNQR